MENTKILLIEDDHDLSESICTMLELKGYNIVCRNDGFSGLELAMEIKPGLIICDLNMPLMDGYEVLEKVRSSEELIDTPFIFLTGQTDEDHRRDGMIRGADDFVAKPFKLDQLIRTIHSVLDKNHYRQFQLSRLSNEVQEKVAAINRINFLTNHQVRANLAKIIQTISLMDDGILSVNDCLPILSIAAGEIDNITIDINHIINADLSKLRGKSKVINLHYKNIVIIDDDKMQLFLNQMVISKTLKTSVTQFLDAREALEFVKNNGADLILLDLNMPHMTGLEFLKELKEANLQIPVAMLSSSMDPEHINSCLSFQNVFQYLVKPLNPHKLKQLAAN